MKPQCGLPIKTLLLALIVYCVSQKQQQIFPPLTIHCASNSPRVDARAVRPYMPLVSNSSYHSSKS